MDDTPRRPGRPRTTGTTTKRNIRVPDDMWDEITAKTHAEGTDASALTRDFYAWYLRRPGARLPRRSEAQG